MIKARINFSCSHLEDNKVEVKVGPHVIEDRGGCESCLIIVENMLHDIELATHPEFYSAVKKRTTMLAISVVANSLFLISLLFALARYYY